LSWLSLAEWKLLERLQWSDRASVEFVQTAVQGVLDGTPVSKSWQQRFLGPLAVSALSRVTHDRLTALKLFAALALGAANLTLFVLLRRRGATPTSAVLAVVCFGLARLVFAYKLEYPWDGIDVLLFLVAGAWAARDGALLPLAPLLLVGVLNHETILYLPLWYLLAPLDGRRPVERKPLAVAATATVILGALTLLLRSWFYRGQPTLPGQVFETATPLIDNHLHVGHNATTLFVSNWTEGRAHLSLLVLPSLALLGWLASQPGTRRAAVWSLVAFATIFCFGYTNETRHYLPLLAFFIAWAWPAPSTMLQRP